METEQTARQLAGDAELASHDLENLFGLILLVIDSINYDDPPSYAPHIGYLNILADYGETLAKAQSERISNLWLAIPR